MLSLSLPGSLSALSIYPGRCLSVPHTPLASIPASIFILDDFESSQVESRRGSAQVSWPTGSQAWMLLLLVLLEFSAQICPTRWRFSSNPLFWAYHITQTTKRFVCQKQRRADEPALNAAQTLGRLFPCSPFAVLEFTFCAHLFNVVPWELLKILFACSVNYSLCMRAQKNNPKKSKGIMEKKNKKPPPMAASRCSPQSPGYPFRCPEPKLCKRLRKEFG